MRVNTLAAASENELQNENLTFPFLPLSPHGGENELTLSAAATVH